MKKLYCLLFTLAGLLFAQSQTIYSENMGSPSSNTLITAYSGWQNTTPIVYTGTGDVRTSAASNGYTGASGSGNVFLTSTAGRFLQIDGINTSAYVASDIQLTFGHLTNSIATQLVLEQSTDGGTNWTPITFTQNPNTSWNLVSITDGQIPSSTTLSLRFTQPATAQMRIDDVKLVNVSSSCTLSLGTQIVSCSASTLAQDQYTITIPYTGGANATYVITGGSVSGDDPTTTASGNIIISVTEGTDYVINISGGTCNFDITGNSPECKPINTLPYNEPFNYTVGNSLGLEQMWTNVNSGDDIVIASGSLTYGSLVGTGNSASFAGVGIDCFTPFTSTTNGTLYTGFMFSVTDLSGVTDTNETYFAVLTDAAQSFQARLFTKKVGTQYQIGFDSASTTTNYDVTLRNEGDVVYVIIGYDFTGNILNAWINPDLSTFNSSTPATLTNTPATAITELGGFLLRQQTDVNTPAITFDELKISTITTDFLGTKSFNAIDGLTMYPNPLSGNTLNFSSTANNTMSVQIFDILGKEVAKGNVVNNTFNTGNLNAGIYIVKVTEEGKTATRKLVVK